METTDWSDSIFYKPGHQVKWFRSGETYFQFLCKLILSARKVIHIQFYIIDPDETGTMILDACKSAAKNGIQVFMLVDRFGSDKLTKEHESELTDSGINFRFFKPLYSKGEFYVGRRMHHKVMVVDNEKAVVGGANIANRYRGNHEEKAWIDYAVLVEGPLCPDLTKYCEKYYFQNFTPKRPTLKFPLQSGIKFFADESYARMRINDSLRGKREISISYNRATRRAKKSITIVGGYFLPGRRYRRILTNAVKRGVEIRIIMTKYSDVKVVKYASDYLYKFLLTNNIKIFESNDTMVHGKVAMVDDTYCTVGSYNQNHLSALLSIELNIDIIDQEFTSGFREHMDILIKTECTEVTKENFDQNSTFVLRSKRWFSYQMLRISLRGILLFNKIFGK